MSSLLVLTVAALTAATAGRSDAPALTSAPVAADSTQADLPTVDSSESRNRRRPPDRLWAGVGLGAGFGVWTRPGRPASFLLGDHLDLELGHRGSSVRGRLSTLRVGGDFVGGEVGALALHAFGKEPSDKGLYVGAEAAAGWSTLGRRVLVGPAIGWRGNFEGRLTASLAYTPATYRSWDALRTPTVGINIGFTLTAHRRWR